MHLVKKKKKENSQQSRSTTDTNKLFQSTSTGKGNWKNVWNLLPLRERQKTLH